MTQPIEYHYDEDEARIDSLLQQGPPPADDEVLPVDDADEFVVVTPLAER